jgi:hypothetical protein
MNHFRDIVSYIRAFTFDNDSEIDLRRNSDSSIKRYIMCVMPIIGINTSFSSETETFSTNLTESDKVRIALESSIIILGGVPEDYSYKNPVMSGRMKFGLAKHIQKLEDMLSRIKSGGIVAASYDEVRKILESGDLLAELTE